jgi:hypothetical protein
VRLSKGKIIASTPTINCHKAIMKRDLNQFQ